MVKLLEIRDKNATGHATIFTYFFKSQQHYICVFIDFVQRAIKRVVYHFCIFNSCQVVSPNPLASAGHRGVYRGGGDLEAACFHLGSGGGE